MEQVEVEVPRPRALEARVELLLGGLRILGLLPGAHLRCHDEALTRIPVDQRLFERALRGAVVVHVCCVEVREPRLHEVVDHGLDLVHVKRAVRALGQAHETETEFTD